MKDLAIHKPVQGNQASYFENHVTLEIPPIRVGIYFPLVHMSFITSPNII